MRTNPGIGIVSGKTWLSVFQLFCTASVLMLILWSSSGFSQDIDRGAQLFNEKCSYCHSLSAQVGPKLIAPPKRFDPAPDVKREPEVDWSVEVGKDKRGPHLQGLFGRAPGAVKGFPYRITLQTENPTWTEADLDYWIYNHARLKEADRSDLIAYLKRSTRK